MKVFSRVAQSALTCIFLACSHSMLAQQAAPAIEMLVDADSPAPNPVTTQLPQQAKAGAPLTARWLDLTTFSHSQRYRNQYADDGTHYFEDGQQRSLLVGKFKFDSAGRYGIGFRASSGKTFNWAYADYAGRGFSARLHDPVVANDVTNPASDPAVEQASDNDPAGVAFVEGVDSAGWDFYPRELYLTLSPIDQATFEFGSFGFERGLSSEITTFDDDGYLIGERLRLKDPKHLWFDQVALTSAFFGDFMVSNLLGRGDGFSKSNYRQIAVKKQLDSRVGISGEYNWISNNARTNTLREAVSVDTHESRIFDKVRVEGYEMLSDVFLQGVEVKPRQGFALVGEKKISKLGGDFGYASINRDYGVFEGSIFAQEVGFSLNGDNYNTGIRVFSHLNYQVNPVVTAFGFYTHMVGQTFTNLNMQGLNAGLTFNLKALVNSQKLVF